ncbi:MAG: acyl-ACP--UDP-N-acetylglucosamine O-acyltransferase [Candidatus Aminicenantes bacterium]|nr:acyl-ACP--UDP-N-acetylglucosamine O-acyltransferase [Candidatus Aminicenantes bacterium]
MKSNGIFIHPTASIHPGAEIESEVYIGPYCVIDQGVRIHRGTRLEAHVAIKGLTEIGENCLFSPYTVIGTEPQDITYKGEPTRVTIGNRNVFREFITVHRGTVKGGGITRIGDDNYFMAYTHIAHDCQIGNKTIFINGATLGGHVEVDDFATVGAFTGVHQFCRIGKYAFIGGFSVITQDVLPYCRFAGMRPAKFYGVNTIGLRRHGFTPERIHNIKEMIKILYFSGLNTSQAVEKIRESFDSHPDREEILNFIAISKRGIIKKVAEGWEIELE